MIEYDVIVVGAGHAGCEAALAASRMGMKTAIFTITLDNIGVMSCNPSIGGPAKGHLVREIDALGGEMARNIDKTFVQIRVLNTRKGPAVRALRAQADKAKYHLEMKKTLEFQEGLDIIQGMISEICVDDSRVTGLKTKEGLEYSAKSIVLATGTFMRGLIHIGDKQFRGGRMGELPSDELPESLEKIGIELGRFKTGTPCRLDIKSIDMEKVEAQSGDTDQVLKFSSDTKDKDVEGREQLPCYITFTNPSTHNFVHDNIERAPLFNGSIDGVGPRYCPSIEDKIVRYKDKERHQVFLEPEGFDTSEIYVNGMSTSLPTDIQYNMIRSVVGLEEAKIMRYGYAIEYDYIKHGQIKYTLETKKIKNFYIAGQINGTSGYEEAAAQGLIAGINASLKLKNKDSLILDRADSYIGTLIDDLVTKGTNEPYRMFTARSEYRLILREDNADIRLSKFGYAAGLLSEKKYQKLEEKMKNIEVARAGLKNISIGPSNKEAETILLQRGDSLLKSGVTLNEFLKRPKIKYSDLKHISNEVKAYDKETEYQIEVQIKYEGYIQKQKKMIEKHKQLETKKIPRDFEYTKIKGLTNEAKEKLIDKKPENLGQASRISGISPADISILIMYMEGKLK